MIPVYNQAGYVEAAIKSALAQDYENLEVVVSDDCSTDQTGAIVRKYMSDDRLKYFRNPDNIGRVANYRRCLEQYATGTWVVNLDADDYYTDPYFISKAVGYIYEENERDVVFLQAGHTVLTDSGERIRIDVPVISEDHVRVSGRKYFLDFRHFSHLATLFNRKRALGLDFYKYDILSTDIESFLRLALHGDVILVKESVGVWLQHGANISRQLDRKVIDQNMLRIESPYLYARTLGTIPNSRLLRWKRKMTSSYLLHYLTLSLKDNSLLPGYPMHVYRSYPLTCTGRVIPQAVGMAMVSKIARLLGIKSRK
jgi:glycosyltransferase involved in cell wall biosynthesis